MGLQRALHSDTAIVFRGVHIDDEPYKVTVRRVRSKKGQGSHALISFESLHAAPPLAAPETEIDLRQVPREQLGALEAELSRTKENLQAATEELETSNEELRPQMRSCSPPTKSCRVPTKSCRASMRSSIRSTRSIKGRSRI